MSSDGRRKSFSNETSREIGQRIRSARGSASQETFAAEIGVSRSALTNYEAGRRLPNDLVLSRIAEVSGVRVESLLFGEPLLAVGDVARRIELDSLRAAEETPGFIPRFMLSDDEYSFIALFRLLQEEEQGRAILRQVVQYWEQNISTAKGLRAAPPVEWGEGHLARLQAAVRRGGLKKGRDPSQDLWVTFWEEVDERRLQSHSGTSIGTSIGDSSNGTARPATSKKPAKS